MCAVSDPEGPDKVPFSSSLPKAIPYTYIYICIYVWFLRPYSIMVLYMDPLRDDGLWD